MIYTVTFNPALDYLVDVEKLNLGLTNRTESETLYPGGKGINVSIVLNNLGISSTALGFIAGFTGKEIAHLLNQRGINTDFIKIKNGFSRINVKIRSEEETEINGQGPAISDSDIKKLYQKIDELQSGDYLVLGGSIPKTMPQNTYEEIAKHIKGKDIKLIVDATKDLLLNVLPFNPYLIKPNNHELEEIFNVKLNSNEEIAKYGQKLIDLGAQNVIISMAGDGAIYITNNQDALFLPAPAGKVVNSVGAGDSTVAGFIAGNYFNLKPEEAFKYAVATGSASAFSELLAEKDLVDKLEASMSNPIDIF